MNIVINSFLLLVILLEFYLIDMKWTDPETVSNIFSFIYGSLGLSIFQANYVPPSD